MLWAFHAFLGDAVVLCHNASFDWITWLKPLMEQAMITFDNQYVCTYKTFQRSLPGLGKGAYTNEAMAALFDFKLEGVQPADADVEATAHSLMGLKSWFDGVDLKALIKKKEEEELAKEDTLVQVESVNFWEKVFGPSKQMKRHYCKSAHYSSFCLSNLFGQKS